MDFETRLTILGLAEKRQGRRYVLCRCTCGTEKVIQERYVLKGNTRSCGCLFIETSIAKVKAMEKHGHAREGSKRTPTYLSWRAMRMRCENPKHDNYPMYGGRGIKICERWLVFENFLADMGERPEGTTLDRINPNGHYEPSNCRWADKTEQSRNRRNTKYRRASYGIV
jgi:hypothetical protein